MPPPPSRALTETMPLWYEMTALILWRTMKSRITRDSGSENGALPPAPLRVPVGPYRPPGRPNVSGDQFGVSKFRFRSTPRAFQAASGPLPTARPSGFEVGTKNALTAEGRSLGVVMKC